MTSSHFQRMYARRHRMQRNSSGLRTPCGRCALCAKPKLRASGAGCRHRAAGHAPTPGAWQKKPRPFESAGVDGGHETHAIWLRKRRDESSRSAMEASDCFRVLPGLVTRLASENSDSCRLNRLHRAGKPKFSIAQTGVIAIFFGRFSGRGPGNPGRIQATRYPTQALQRNTE